ncbi:MAG: hypothetical protein DRQ44_16445 [Gammaproteobacteria bacterium]|nr:MAG: hypothetical protein DRQ44_16445 [Gammaproteobacteria bacterium]
MQKTMQQSQLDLSQKKTVGQPASRFILAQLITTLALSATLLIIDYTVAYSALAGGLIATLANGWFALKVFRIKPNETAETLLATFYVGAIYKFVFTGAMFVIVFVVIETLNVVAFLGLYFLIHMTPAVVNVLSKETFDTAGDK